MGRGKEKEKGNGNGKGRKREMERVREGEDKEGHPGSFLTRAKLLTQYFAQPKVEGGRRICGLVPIVFFFFLFLLFKHRKNDPSALVNKYGRGHAAPPLNLTHTHTLSQVNRYGLDGFSFKPSLFS